MKEEDREDSKMEKAGSCWTVTFEGKFYTCDNPEWLEKAVRNNLTWPDSFTQLREYWHEVND